MFQFKNTSARERGLVVRMLAVLTLLVLAGCAGREVTGPLPCPQPTPFCESGEHQEETVADETAGEAANDKPLVETVG